MNIWATSDRGSIPSGSFDEAVVRGYSRYRDAVVFAKWHATLNLLDVIVPLPPNAGLEKLKYVDKTCPLDRH